MQKISPFLWFNNNAEEAMNFYTSVFKDSRIVRVTRYGNAGPGPSGTVMAADFELLGQRFTVLNGGPQFTFTEAISFLISCETQEEVDYYWKKLSAGGSEGRCGWLKDQFGLSWQVVPTALSRLLQAGNAQKSQNVMRAMMQMGKMDIQSLQEAYDRA